MQTLPESQASSVAETHGPVAYPYLDALHQEFPVSPAQQPTSNNQTATKTKPQLAQHRIHKRHAIRVRQPNQHGQRTIRAAPIPRHAGQASTEKGESISQRSPERPRRRAQNRASQRAYRERKEQRIRDLEHLLQEAHRREETLTQAYLFLRTEYDRLSSEQEDGSSMGTPTPVTGETMPARFGAASMQHCSDVVGGFDFSLNAYEYADDTQQ
ncbi:bZIP transcription factor, bZIP-1, partial [Metarhizium majus ARSEF 297]